MPRIVLGAALWAGLVCGRAPAADRGELPDFFSIESGRFRAALRSSHPAVRRAGVQGLSYLRHHTFEPDLIRALGDDDADVVSEAALGLGRLGRRDSVAPLIDLLASDAHDVRVQAALALERITNHHPPAEQRTDMDAWRAWWNRQTPAQREDSLIAQLADAKRRPNALRALRRLGGPKTEAALLALPGQAQLSPAEQRLAIEALGPVATAKSLPVLVPFAAHPAVAWALGDLGGPQAEQALLDALRGPQLQVLINLDRLHSRRAFAHAPMLVQAFGLVSYRSQPDDLHQPPTPVQRLAARLLLRTGRGAEIVDVILAKLDGKPLTVAKTDDPIIKALQQLVSKMDPELKPGFHRADGYAHAIPLCAMSHLIRDQGLVPRLIALLDHPAYVVRVYVATALGRLRATRAVAPITAMLREGYPFGDATSQVSGKHGSKISRFVRWKGYLAMALGDIGDDAARRVLEAMLADASAHRDIRYGAAVGLGRIASPQSRDALMNAARHDLVRWIRQQAAWALQEIDLREHTKGWAQRGEATAAAPRPSVTGATE